MLPPGLASWDPTPYLASAIPIAVSVVGVNFVHELGHRIAALVRKVKLGPTYFVPNLQVRCGGGSAVSAASHLGANRALADLHQPYLDGDACHICRRMISCHGPPPPPGRLEAHGDSVDFCLFLFTAVLLPTDWQLWRHHSLPKPVAKQVGPVGCGSSWPHCRHCCQRSAAGNWPQPVASRWPATGKVCWHQRCPQWSSLI